MILISALDQMRAATLRRTLSNELLRHWYQDRALRLFLLFLGSVAFYLPLSLLFPLWVLAIGPLIWGVPHLLASTRFVSQGLRSSSQSFYRLSGFVLLAIFILKLVTDRRWIHFPIVETDYFDLSLIAVAFGVAALAIRQWCTLRPWLTLLLVLLPMFWFPMEALGLLILAHNFVAFGYWIYFARMGRERKFAWLATGLFSAINLMIFSGALDGLYQWIDVPTSLAWAGLDYGEIGQLILPWSDNYIFWFHAVVAYAFGQSIHYYVWLKAIPESSSPRSLPLNFRQSYQILVKEMGSPLVVVTAFLAVGLLGVWLLHSYALARDLYFLMALYHGYLEIGSLPWLAGSKV